MESAPVSNDSTQSTPPVPVDTTDKAQRLQDMLLARRPEIEAAIREAVQIVRALESAQTSLPKKRKPRKDNRVRVREYVPQVRSEQQLAKRRRQRLQRISYVRTSARAEKESRRIRDAREVASLAQKRYQHFRNKLNRGRLRELDDRFAELLQAEEVFPPQLPDMKDL
jgi:hypothetical protein